MRLSGHNAIRLGIGLFIFFSLLLSQRLRGLPTSPQPKLIKKTTSDSSGHRSRARVLCAMAFTTAPPMSAITGQLGLWNFTDYQSHVPNKSVLACSNFSFVSYTDLRKELPLPNKSRFCSHFRMPRNRSAMKNAVIVSAAAKPLNLMPFRAVINKQGRIQPTKDIDTAASVFAVFDRNKRIQYIGFSKGLKNSLRTLMGRRPELCYFYKAHNLTSLDQQLMLSIRQQWISELGSTPPGNTDPAEKALWEQPSVASSISERGKAASAASKAKELQQMLLDRGLKEEMVFDPVLLEQGKCDVLPSKELSPQEQAEAARAQAAAAAERKQVSVPIPSGGVLEYEITYEMKWKTNGGWMYDIAVNYDDRETRHRVIVGRFYPEAAEMPEDDFLEVVIAFLLNKKIPRHTEGVLRSSEFNINYFAIGEAAQRFEDIQEWFEKELPDDHWRFVKTNSYGAHVDPAPPVGPLEFSKWAK
eukprot:Gb_22550 [translate_table: standard]